MLLVFCLGACGGFVERRAARTTFSILQGSRTAMQQSGDIELVRLATPGGLVQLEAFHLAYPDHRGFLTMLTEGYCQYALGFAQSDWEESVLAGNRPDSEALRKRALGLFDRCERLALEMLGAKWSKAAADEALAERIASARKREVDGMMWLAIGTVSKVAMDPLQSGSLVRLALAESLLRRSVELDEGHADGLAHVMLGSIACTRPRLLGGDPEEGKRHFLRAKQLAGEGMLMIDVIFARSYGVAVADRAWFRKILSAVVNADLNRWPERRLSNTLAREKALAYLAAQDRFFKP